MLQTQAAGANSIDSAVPSWPPIPRDLKLKLALAEALAAAGQYAEALALCLDLVSAIARASASKPARSWSRSSGCFLRAMSLSPSISGNSRWYCKTWPSDRCQRSNLIRLS